LKAIENELINLLWPKPFSCTIEGAPEPVLAKIAAQQQSAKKWAEEFQPGVRMHSRAARGRRGGQLPEACEGKGSEPLGVHREGGGDQAVS